MATASLVGSVCHLSQKHHFLLSTSNYGRVLFIKMHLFHVYTGNTQIQKLVRQNLSVID